MTDATAQGIRHRWWAGDADVNELAREFCLSDLYVELVMRRLLFDGLPLVPGERALVADTDLETARPVTGTPASAGRRS